MDIKRENFNKILAMDSYDLIDNLTSNFLVDMPEVIASIDDMEAASKKLLALTAGYSFVTALQNYAKVATREAKRTLSKQEHEDMIDKRDIIATIADTIKQQYNGLSRAITIKIENNKELNMTGCR